MLQQQLAFIITAFRGRSEVVTHLEGRGKTTNSIQVYENVLHNWAAPELSKYKVKFENVISKNPDFKVIVNVAKVLGGENVPEFSVGPSKISKFAYCQCRSGATFFVLQETSKSPERAVHNRAQSTTVFMWNNDSSL